MCELFAMNFNKKVRPSISFRGFTHRSNSNPHGWGLAFYPDKSCQVYKEPISAGSSDLANFVRKYKLLKSKIFIGHVRFSSVGEKKYKNTHPFVKESKGRNYCFAHNGTLFDYASLDYGFFKPVGETDSEHIFGYILNEIYSRRIRNWRNNFNWLCDKFRGINSHGTFNAILSQGKYLFCYRDINGYNSLYYLKREAPFNHIRLLDEDWSIDLNTTKHPSEKGYIIATRPLTNENWERFERGQLIVFKDGERIY
jgi:predicted glutamine amidotransferase